MFSGSRRSYGVQGGSSGHRNRWPRRQQYCIGQKSLFHTVSNSYTLCIDNQILLRFDVPDNQILLRFGAPDNQILLHLGVPDNCSSGPGMAGRIYSLSSCRGHRNGVKFGCRGHRNGVKFGCRGH